jgi:hypothetical protein
MGMQYILDFLFGFFVAILVEITGSNSNYFILFFFALRCSTFSRFSVWLFFCDSVEMTGLNFNSFMQKKCFCYFALKVIMGMQHMLDFPLGPFV